jgi:DNA-directed RNA polymerase specialized sigma24 family protein
MADAGTYELTEPPPPAEPPRVRPVPEIEVPEKLLRRANRGKPAAIEEIARLFYPFAYRAACGLTGRDDLGDAVARDVTQRSVGQVPKWREPAEPGRWFRHHTVLAVREQLARHLGTRRDLLADDADSPEQTAQLAALRKLPHQQREAFILTHLERLGPRSLAQAMDCSTEAAANHLRSAEATLRPLTNGNLLPLIERLEARYRRLTPPADVADLKAKRHIRRKLLPHRAWATIRWTLLLTAMAAMSYGLWQVVPLLEF